MASNYYILDKISYKILLCVLFVGGSLFVVMFFPLFTYVLLDIFNFTPNILINYILLICILLSLILSAALLTVFERQVLGSIQLRKGPNVIGFLGLFQPIADAVKLLVKEPIIPNKAVIWLFIFSSIILLGLSLVLWAVLPFYTKVSLLNINVALLYFLSISSLSIYGVILAGWASNSRYAFLGALRACAQMLSYELVLSMIIFLFIICSGSTTITAIISAQKNIWFGFVFMPFFCIFFICALAETNRAPFDLPEAESESVSGYNLDYSSIIFAFFFLAEYLHILLMSNLVVILFLGGWLPLVTITPMIVDVLLVLYNLSYVLCFIFAIFVIPCIYIYVFNPIKLKFENLFIYKQKIHFAYVLFCLFLLFIIFEFFNIGALILFEYWLFYKSWAVVWYISKLIFVIYLFIWIRSTLPRFRYDQLMTFGWKVLVPTVLGLILFYLFIIFFCSSSIACEDTQPTAFLETNFVYDLAKVEEIKEEKTDGFKNEDKNSETQKEEAFFLGLTYDQCWKAEVFFILVVCPLAVVITRSILFGAQW